MNKKIAIIGASYLQLPLIEKAKELGSETHVFAWAANDVGEKVEDYFYPISIIEKEQIEKVCEEVGVCGICSIASDLAAVTVNYVAEKMGLVGNGMECALISTNKHLMRLAFEKAGDPSPKSVLVDENTDLDKTKTIMVYCKSGVRSNKAYNTLKDLGYDVVDLGAYDKVELEKE